MVKYSSPLAIWILQRTWIKMLKCIHVKYSGSMFKCIGNKFYFLWNVEKAQIFSFPTFKYPNCQPRSGLFFKYCRALLCYQTGMTPTSIWEGIPDIGFTYLTFQLIRPLVLVALLKAAANRKFLFLYVCEGAVKLARSPRTLDTEAVFEYRDKVSINFKERVHNQIAQSYSSINRLIINTLPPP